MAEQRSSGETIVGSLAEIEFFLVCDVSALSVCARPRRAPLLVPCVLVAAGVRA